VNASDDHTPTAIRIVIVDDHPVVRDGIRHMLSSQSDMEVIGEAEDGREAVDLIRREEPDVALMDLQMPGLDGVGAIAELARHNSTTQVLVLTTYDTDADILNAIDAGAAGYLLKDTPREQLYDAIRAAAGGEPALTPRVTARLMGHLRDGHAETLSAREIEVLALVATGNKNRDIAKRLHVGESTVKSHLVHIYRKLDVDDRTHAVTVAIERGLLRLDPQTDRPR
jgi:DNA-binding NarL/FixJ family response regulator